jgi:hypothetical protein
VYQVIQAQTFWDCVNAMRRDDQYKGALIDTLSELQQRPFGNPKLQTHDVGKATNGKPLYTSDVGGRRSDRRIVWQLFNRTIVLLLYGTHAVQERGKRIRVGFDEARQYFTVYELVPGNPEERDYQRQRAELGKLYLAWTDAELREYGFDAATVAVLRTLNNDDELLALEGRLGEDMFERSFNLVAFGQVEGPSKVTSQLAGDPAEEPAATEADVEVERQLLDPEIGSRFSRAEPEFLAEVLGRPIEDWMIFLHPDQRAIVSARFTGPARVRGGAGTGKTVVGLHRAAWLAEQQRGTGVPPILFTTFIKSLPPVFEALYSRLPGTRAGEVEFLHIDKLARRVCDAAGDRVRTVPREIDAAYASAWKRIAEPGSGLAASGLGRQYLRDEITSVIKGRGLASLDLYLAVERVGRRARLGKVQRTQVWELKEAWGDEMARRGTVDFPDVVIRARDRARQAMLPRFSSAVIDEAQDLTLVGLQLVRALVNGPAGDDQPNGLLLLGDGAQRIYPGGFKLRQAGVEVRGRTTVLRTNYRNTEEIIGAALATAGDEEIVDLAESFRRGDEASDTDRHGSAPLLVKADGAGRELDELASRVAALIASGRAGPGDVGVLVPTNRQVSDVVARLARAGLETQKLDDYDGRPNDQVKVGTFHRAKGLEFKVVFLPGLSEGQFPRAPQADQHPEEADESARLAVSQLFVAMTRARDHLVLLCHGSPSSVFAPHLDRFEVVEASS